MHRQELPQKDETVMVEIMDTDESYGAHVYIPEYDCEGMIPISELSHRKVRLLSRVASIGSFEPACVIHSEPGRIDLNKRYLNDNDRLECRDKYYKAKHVQTILNGETTK